ncbi:methyl-accepting chemotaxis protein, partial [Melaminivora alkalimesophila]
MTSSRTTMSVAARLGLGFALVILAGAAGALLGSAQIRKVQHSTTLLVEDRMVKVEQITQMLGNLNIVARASRNIALLDEQGQREQEAQRIEQARARTGELFGQLQGSITDPAGQEVLQKIEKLHAPYNETIDKAVDMAMIGQGIMATDVLLRENRPLQAAYFEALDELIGVQKAAMLATAEEAQRLARTATWTMAALAAFAALGGALIAWLLTRSITRQLGGEPDYAASVAREIAAGNLAVQVNLRAGDTSSLLATMGAMRDSLAQVVARVRQGSEAVALASTEIAQGNQDLSGRTESQASALQETAASMEQLGSTVQQNADNARQANQLAQSASAVALQGGEVVAQVVDTMRGINEASHRIADIIQVIDSIAFQTNILALNAAVEAARAGEQGRGFAVVAGEVRTLAQRSAEAAREIKQLITDSAGRVEQGTALVDRAGSTMQEVVASIRRVTDIVGEISAASSEQSQGVLQVGEAVQQMDQVTQQNAALVE